MVQAAGAVTINATQRIDNSVVRANRAGAGAINARGDATADPRQAQTQVRALNPQLPPDLAQRQVNPVTLPSFSLPQGINGLFRISSQAGQAAASGAAIGATGDLTQAGSGIFIAPLADTASADIRSAQALGANSSASAQGAGTIGVALEGLAAGLKLVQGVPERTVPSISHKYLVETNPVLTNLKQFLSSDYLLGQLNVKPDQAIKRLGDGLYEQRLIREAVVARTGQRYIDGMTSDETLFRYLMDNAIASKQQLSLSVGVSLSAEQVAALTHDIVWMEQVEVNGEKVLAPVLYLAHANGRLAPNGALIQGRDVNLISGAELVNVGTLRASNNLALSAGGINNAGLMAAGGRLDMLAIDSIRNAQGGIIAGREVNLTALTGDVINERSVNRLLHDAEKKALTAEAAELQKRLGKPGTDLSWDDLLLLAANAEVDATENKRLQALLRMYDPTKPEGQHFAYNLMVAQQSISKLAAQDIVLTWKDGRPIMADGDEVKAFQASAKQFQDHGLFNTDSKWTQASGNSWAGDVDMVPEAWKRQFGEKNAALYLRETRQVPSSPAEMKDLMERISVIATGGVKDVTVDLDIALAMTGAPAVLRALLAKRVSAAMAEAGGAAAGKDSLVDAGGHQLERAPVAVRESGPGWTGNLATSIG